MSLKMKLELALESSVNLEDLKLILTNFKENSGTKEEAHFVLYELLLDATTKEVDEKLRELIDLTINFSGKKKPIWD